MDSLSPEMPGASVNQQVDSSAQPKPQLFDEIREAFGRKYKPATTEIERYPDLVASLAEKPRLMAVIDPMMPDTVLVAKKLGSADELTQERIGREFCQKNGIKTLRLIDDIETPKGAYMITAAEEVTPLSKRHFESIEQVHEIHQRGIALIARLFQHGMYHPDIGFNLATDRDNGLLILEFQGIELTEGLPVNQTRFTNAVEEFNYALTRALREHNPNIDNSLKEETIATLSPNAERVVEGYAITE